MVIGHNIPALITRLNMKKNDRFLTASMQRLGSGTKINSVKDDPAGLAISNKLAYQVSGINRASQNATHGISMIQTAEGALNEVHNMLQRMRELAVQASTGSLETEDRAKIQTEIDELVEEITATANRTEFNKMKILNGEAARITNNYSIDASGQLSLNRTIASPLYISNSVPAGDLRYTINQPGLPASVAGVPRDPNFTVGTTGGFTINGIEIAIEETDSYEKIQAKIMATCDTVGVNYAQQADGSTLLTTQRAGTDQQITVSGNAGLLAYFGLQPSHAQGTNAAITINGLYDENGNAISSFQQNLSVVTAGNQVTITATDGQVVKLNLQVSQLPSPLSVPPVIGSDPMQYTANPAAYTYGDGTTAIANAAIGTVTNMSLRIENYGPIMLQVGANYNMAVSLYIPAVTAETLGLAEYKGGKMHKLLNYEVQDGASEAIEKMDDAIAMVSHIRSSLGAYQNRLEQTIRSLDVSSENMEAARSRIQDTDMAAEMTAYTQRNVMYQAGLAILGQANQRPQQLLSLLQ